jgi:hypothetical protein
MGSFRFFVSFTASVGIHAVLGYVVIVSPSPVRSTVLEPIQIDYVRYDKTETPVVKAQLVEEKPKAVRKKLKGIPIPRERVVANSAEGPVSDFQKIVDEKVKKQMSQLKYLETPVSEKRISSSMTSAELIANPVKGKIFIGYFGQVKQKIQNTVLQKAGRKLYGQGSVCLGFVLNAQGQLEHVTVLAKGTHADDPLKELAATCIRDSAPFGSFPKDLGPRRIFFNITIFFDGL